jgi:hypothetical protein
VKRNHSVGRRVINAVPSYRRLLVAAVALVPLLLPSASNATPCRATPRILTAQTLTIFGVRYHDQGGGVLEYACLGPKARPLFVGSEDDNYGGRTQAYAYDGARFLATHNLDIGEGGGDANLEVFDLKTHHTIGFRPAVEADFGDPPPFRVTAGGGLVAQQDDGAITYFPPRGARTVLSTPGAHGDEVALMGSTAYWTEGETARSAQIAGPPTPVENQIVPHVDVPRPSSRCESQAGRTIAGTARVRVFVHGNRALVCRAHGVRRSTIPRGDVRIAADRWVLVAGHAGALTLLDGLGREPTRRIAQTTSSTLLPDGTLAWIDRSGALQRQTPSATAPDTLAPVADLPTALASSTKTIYWTTSGGLVSEARIEDGAGHQ